jgi:hypothetical protein
MGDSQDRELGMNRAVTRRFLEWRCAPTLWSHRQRQCGHRQLWLRETGWDEEETSDYADYLADFRAEFHDLRESDARGVKEQPDALSPDSYVQSQALAAQFLGLGSAGIVYPSVRRVGGTCIVCFRPVLVTNVRKGDSFKFVFSGTSTPLVIRKA